jgi:hypothetical protein
MACWIVSSFEEFVDFVSAARIASMALSLSSAVARFFKEEVDQVVVVGVLAKHVNSRAILNLVKVCFI